MSITLLVKSASYIGPVYTQKIEIHSYFPTITLFPDCVLASVPNTQDFPDRIYYFPFAFFTEDLIIRLT